MREKRRKLAIDTPMNDIKLQDVKPTKTFLVSTMPDETETRKRRFRAALALEGLTQEQWAEQRGVSGSHLSNVLSGRFPSDAVDEMIAAYLAEHSADAA